VNLFISQTANIHPTILAIFTFRHNTDGQKEVFLFHITPQTCREQEPEGSQVLLSGDRKGLRDLAISTVGRQPLATGEIGPEVPKLQDNYFVSLKGQRSVVYLTF